MGLGVLPFRTAEVIVYFRFFTVLDQER